jgi:hypothetical protein
MVWRSASRRVATAKVMVGGREDAERTVERGMRQNHFVNSSRHRFSQRSDHPLFYARTRQIVHSDVKGHRNIGPTSDPWAKRPSGPSITTISLVGSECNLRSWRFTTTTRMNRQRRLTRTTRVRRWAMMRDRRA